MQQEVTVLEVEWSETLGSTSSVGMPYLFAWLRAEYLQPGMIADGHVLVLARDERSPGWTQYQGPVSEPEAVTLICMLSGIGIPGFTPRIESVADPSDTLYTSSVRIGVYLQQQTISVTARENGFTGEDAEGLRAVLERILGLAGAPHERSMFARTGVSKA